MSLIMLVVGTVLGLLAGATAWLITYQEYARHFPDRRRVVRASAEAAAVAFAFFLGVSIIIGLVLDRTLPFR